jgi:predicted nucleic acid-binding protein
MYVFDADSLIHAYRDDFPPGGEHSGFWNWLDNIGSQEGIIIPEKVLEELSKKTDGLNKFLSNYPNLKNEPTVNCLEVLHNVLYTYGDLSDVDVEILERKADPYVISHAMILNATVVSCEVSEPYKIGINKKIPDICDALDISFESYPRFLWRMRGVYPN